MNKDFFLYERENTSNKLIIFFSGAGAKNFTGYKLIKNIKINKLFIRDPNRTWFNNEINGVSEDIDDLILKISIIVDNYDKNNVYIIGGSMGGYVALLVGFQLQIKNILAFSPQMIIDYRMPNMPKKTLNIKYPNLYNELDISDNLNLTNIRIWFGAEDFNDLYQMIPLKKYNSIKVYPIKFSPHNLMHYLHKQNFLKPIIINFINNTVYNFAYIEDNMYMSHKVDKIVPEAIELYYSGNYMKSITKLLSIESNFDNSSIFFFLGMCYSKINDTVNAEKYLLRSLDFFPFSTDTYYQLSLLYIQKQDFILAEKSITKSMEYGEQVSSRHLNKLGVIHMYRGNLDESLDIQRQALEMDSNNSEIHYQLGLVYFKLKDYKLSLKHYYICFELNPSKPNIEKHISTVKKYYIEDIVKIFKLESVNELVSYLNEKN